MKWFNNMRIQWKLILSFGLVIALLAVVTLMSVTNLKNTAADFQNSVDHPVAAKSAMLRVQNEFRDVKESVAQMIIFENDNERCAALLKSLEEYYANALGYLDEAKEAISTNEDFTAEDIAARLPVVEEIRGLINEYHDEIAVPVAAAITDGELEKAMEIYGAASSITPQIKEKTTNMIALSEKTSAEFLADDVAQNQKAVMGIAIIAGAALFSALLVSVILTASIKNPLTPLTEFFVKAGETGDIILSDQDTETIGKYAGRRDEIGQLIAGAASFVEHMNNVSAELENIAYGDLTSEIELLSEHDVMGNSLKYMIENLNDMFEQIKAATWQVAVGSEQIATSATNQASSIEQLSTSVAEITAKTKSNALLASDAATLANSIMENAHNSNEQMTQMIQAVEEINEASKSIKKVIKAIDDIAFQTNILALNASVEAAKAGSAGKGFAVVADEVRNLAAKSAVSAKDTETLISNSLEKTQLGTEIASKTAESLGKIVFAITESNQINSQIADFTEAQSVAIDQINTAVQQNSATVQQSAAASQEMSGQAEILKDLIAGFELREKEEIDARKARMRNRVEIYKSDDMSVEMRGIDFNKLNEYRSSHDFKKHGHKKHGKKHKMKDFI